MKFDREKIKSLIESNGFEDVGDVQEAMKELFGDIIKEMLEGELEEELGYSKHDYKTKRLTIPGMDIARRQLEAITEK